MIPINWNPGRRELRSFARIWFPLFVLLLGGMIWWRAESLRGAEIVWGAGAVVALAVLASPQVAKWVFVTLIVVTYPIGYVVSTVVLAILFYLLFTPIALGMRLAGRDALRLRTRAERSNWTPYEQVDDAERAFRQY
jgi:hypothetical protein